jgi:hypothetical protein
MIDEVQNFFRQLFRLVRADLDQQPDTTLQSRRIKVHELTLTRRLLPDPNLRFWLRPIALATCHETDSTKTRTARNKKID